MTTTANETALPPAPPAPPATMSPRWSWGWKSWAAAIVIFVAGAVCGSGVTVMAAVRKVQFAVQHPEVLRKAVAAHMVRRLDLNADQTQRVEEIMQRRQKSLIEIRRDVQPRVEAELDAMRDEVSGVLNPEQRARWEQMYSEVRSRWLPPRAPVTREPS